MRNKHHCPTPLRQQLLQPLDGLDVEVVGWLVEQQHVGMTQENLRQLNTHTPTSGELAGGTLKVAAQEAQAYQRTLDSSLLSLSTKHHIALVLSSIALH